MVLAAGAGRRLESLTQDIPKTLLPVDGDPTIVFPAEARYVGEHATSWIDRQEFVDRPGEWIADAVRGQRVGVYGLDYVMTVRDYATLQGACELVPWDVAFDQARMVKSELELESVRESVRINTEGFWIFLEHFEPGKTAREVLAPCEEYFVAQGCGRWTMDMVLDGPNGSALPEFKIAGAKRFEATDCVLPSLEVAGPGGHWVEVSRAICPGEPNDETTHDHTSQNGISAGTRIFSLAVTWNRSTARRARRGTGRGPCTGRSAAPGRSASGGPSRRCSRACAPWPA
jgi:Xaa-Pro aminopeptidase